MFSLFFHSAAQYIRAFRELYEAFVLSSFVYYIIELLGGEDQLAITLRTKDVMYGQHGFIFKHIFGEWQMGEGVDRKTHGKKEIGATNDD